MSRRRRHGRGLLAGMAIMALLGFALHRGLIALAAMPRAVLPAVVLVAGTSPAVGPSGVVQVASLLLLVSHQRGRTAVLIIPPDTRVTLNGYGSQVISRAYTFGGTRLLAETVSSLLQVAPMPVAVMPAPALAAEIDQLGAVHVGASTESGSEVVGAWQAAAGSGAKAAAAATVALLPELVGGGEWLKAPLFAEGVWANTTGSLSWSMLIAEARTWGEGPALIAEVVPGATLHFTSGDQWLVVPADAARAWQAELAGAATAVRDPVAEGRALALERGK